jgi:hypothetical protein
MSRALITLFLSILISGAIFTGCQQTCGNLPNQSPANIRILNAVTGVDTLDVYVDGKLFGSGYYNLNDYGINGRPSFGYRSAFINGGALLTSGTHHITAKNGTTVLLDTDLLLADHRQTLAFIGRVDGSVSVPVQVKFLDDAVASSGVQSLIRFVHGVSDLSGIDVYFADTIILAGGHPKPNLTFNYSQISDHLGGGSGTGRSANDYIPITGGSNGLVVTAHGDTSNKIITVNIPFGAISGLLSTIVLRGQTEPIDKEASVSTILLTDGAISTGGESEIESYYIRLANATRLDTLDLLIASSTDQNPRVPRSTANTPFPSQEKVLNIPMDSIGDYMPLNPSPSFHFWFSSTIYSSDTIYHFDKTSKANDRYTFIAIDTMPFGFNGPDYGALILTDTVGIPADAGYGRIRFVNASPDHIMNFTFAGKSYSMKQRDVAFADTTIGHYSIGVSDGGKSGTIAFDVLSGKPVTIYFMPATATQDFPYTVQN